MAMEIDDDVFFADLNKQIAQLIMDEDEVKFPIQSTPLHFQGFQHMPQTQPYMYDMSYRNESKGTGVFFPRSSSIPKKKNRNTRKSSSHNNQQQLHITGVQNSGDGDNNDRSKSSSYRNSSSLQNHK